MLISAVQTVPVLVAASVLVVTVLVFLLLRGPAGRRKGLPVTLQDPTVKYPLRLTGKQVATVVIRAVESVQLKVFL